MVPSFPLLSRESLVSAKKTLIEKKKNRTESISNLGPKIWDLVPSNLKEISDSHKYEKAIKQWKPEDCPCRLCKVFVQIVGFLEKNNLKEVVI